MAGQLQLRLASLDLPESEVARLRSLLTGKELARGNRLLDIKRREKFFAGRGLLREALAGYLGEEPALVELLAGEFGKPQLPEQQEGCPHPDPLPEGEGGKLAESGEGVRPPLFFNLAHAGSCLLLAFCAGRELGVDLEEVRQDLDFAPMARRYFSQREQEELFSLDPSRQLPAFYRCWTRKEAYMKATGTGFSQPSTAFDVSLLPDEPPALLAHRLSPNEPLRWELLDVEVPEGYLAALAIERAD
jgi:4'-phosphopantetheinyl transferase